MCYTIDIHNHRFAAWAAARAASASPLCRFKVKDGFAILEDSGFVPAFASSSQLPAPEKLDEIHCQWRMAVIAAAQNKSINFSHGVAAKIINCYLKSRFVCAGDHEDERVQALHPPIDRVLLEALARQNIRGHAKQWREFCKAGWSKFDSATYQCVIDLIRESLPPGKPLWMVEEYWTGYR